MLNTNTTALQLDNSEAVINNNLQIMTVEGVKVKIEGQDIFLYLEDVAKGLGFIQKKNNVIYIRWETVFAYLDEFGFSQLVGKDSYIPENVFYKLCFKAKNEIAMVFQDKVTDEILPSIRKNGMYATEITVDKMLSDPDFAISLLTKLKEERQARVKAEQTNAILIHTNKVYTTTELANEVGFKSAQQLNKYLVEKNIQYKVNSTFVLKGNYDRNALIQLKQSVLESGKVVYDRRWTGIGREFIINLINKNNNDKSIS